jgi:hypothetical protein
MRELRIAHEILMKKPDEKKYLEHPDVNGLKRRIHVSSATVYL